MTAKENANPENEKTPNFILYMEKGSAQADLFIGNNWITGPILVGDRIKDPASGRLFEAVKRTWLSGKNRAANIAIHVKELPPEADDIR